MGAGLAGLLVKGLLAEKCYSVSEELVNSIKDSPPGSARPKHIKASNTETREWGITSLSLPLLKVGLASNISIKAKDYNVVG